MINYASVLHFIPIPIIKIDKSESQKLAYMDFAARFCHILNEGLVLP